MNLFAVVALGKSLFQKLNGPPHCLIEPPWLLQNPGS